MNPLCLGIKAEEDMSSYPRESQLYLNCVAASFFILALTKQTVGFHIMARNRHGLHYMQAVAVKNMKTFVISTELRERKPLKTLVQ